jgi:hypothetical protein
VYSAGAQLPEASAPPDRRWPVDPSTPVEQKTTKHELRAPAPPCYSAFCGLF